MNENRAYDREIEIDMRKLMKKLPLVCLAAVLCAALAFGGTLLFAAPQYESSVSFYIGSNTGDLYASPLVQGRVIICFIGLFLVAASFGFIYGNYRSLINIARSLGAAFSLYAPALLAVLPATGIMPCVEFAGFLPLLHIDVADVAVVSDIIYLLPFLYVMAVLQAQQRNTTDN